MVNGEQLPELAFGRRHPLDFPHQYRELVRAGDLVRVRTPAGDPAWLATRYEDVQTILAHPAMGRAHPSPDSAPRFSGSPMFGGPIGSSETERAEHQRMRQALNRAFSGQRAEAMRPQVQAIVGELLDRMAQLGPPADLHEAFSFPLPVQVICALLGVPVEDRDRFRGWSTGATSMVDTELAASSLTALTGYVEGLIEAKRAEPEDDVISELLAADREGRLSAGEVVRLAGVLLIAGHETTVARIDAGVLLLLAHATEMAALVAHPELAVSASEEILRMSMAATGVTLRYAQADVPIRGTTIRSGELVLVSTAAANRDPRVFADPDRFDIRRNPNPQIAFAYGAHHCLGAALARVELQCVFGALFQRFPTLTLAVSMDELRLRTDLMVGGVMSLPVSW